MEITQHAYQRAKKRFSWTGSTLDRMAAKALAEGMLHAEAKGKLRKYLDGVWLRHRNGNFRIYGQNLYIFVGEKLVTLYRIPSELVKYCKF